MFFEGCVHGVVFAPLSKELCVPLDDAGNFGAGGAVGDGWTGGRENGCMEGGSWCDDVVADRAEDESQVAIGTNPQCGADGGGVGFENRL